MRNTKQNVMDKMETFLQLKQVVHIVIILIQNVKWIMYILIS
jgi:hypothetical protein